VAENTANVCKNCKNHGSEYHYMSHSTSSIDDHH